MKAPEIKIALVQALARLGDQPLSERGFWRSSKAIFYARSKGATRQIFDLGFAAHLSYDREALAHIYPRIRLEMKDVGSVASARVDGNPVLVANAPELLLNRPFEHFAPKPERIQWYARNLQDFDGIVESVITQFGQWGAPFFDDYWSALDIIRGYEADDERPRLQQSWWVFVIAAYVSVGRITEAFAVAEKAFSALGTRRKYDVVFVNLQRISDEAGRIS